jgi:tRNA(Ile2) C34 agmatinyltransferase TiaS
VSGALAVAPRVAEPAGAGGGLTLEQHLSEVLERARVHQDAPCPVCHGAMERSGDGARCRDCGSRIS